MVSPHNTENSASCISLQFQEARAEERQSIGSQASKLDNYLHVITIARSVDRHNYVSNDFFHSRAVHLDIIKVFLFTNDAQENFFKKYEYIKIYIKTAPTCFSANTIIKERII